MSIKALTMSITFGAVTAGLDMALGKSINKIGLVGKTVDKLKNKRLDLKKNFQSGTGAVIKLQKELKKIDNMIGKINMHKLKIQANIDKRNDIKSSIMDKVAIGATIALPFKFGIEFESSMARVKALANANDEEFKKLNDTAKKLGATTTFSASEVAQGMGFLSMAGFKANDTVDAMSGLLNLASAGQTDLATTSDIASNILSGFSLKAGEMGRVADVMAKAMTSANVNTQMLGDTMKYVAPVASSVGASIEEVTALTAKLGDVGIQGSQAGTTLKSMYARLASPPSEAVKMLEELGVETKNADGSFKGIIPLIGELNNATDGMADAEKAEAMKKIFGLESMGGAIALLKVGQKGLKDYQNTLESANGTAKEIAKTQNDTVAGSFKALGSAVEGLSISFSTLFLPVLKQITGAITWTASALSSFTENHKTLATVVGGVVAGFGSFVVIASVVGYGFTFISNAVHKTRMMFTLAKATLMMFNGSLAITNIKLRATAIIGTVTRLIKGFSLMTTLATAKQWLFNIALNANPIGLIVAGITALIGLGYALYQKFEPVRELFLTIGSVGGKIASWLGFGGSDEEVKKPKIPQTSKIALATATATQLATASPNMDISQAYNTAPIQQANNIQVTFGDIKVETLDGKISDPKALQAQIQQAVETALANVNNDRNLSDEV